VSTCCGRGRNRYFWLVRGPHLQKNIIIPNHLNSCAVFMVCVCVWYTHTQTGEPRVGHPLFVFRIVSPVVYLPLYVASLMLWHNTIFRLSCCSVCSLSALSDDFVLRSPLQDMALLQWVIGSRRFKVTWRSHLWWDAIIHWRSVVSQKNGTLS